MKKLTAIMCALLIACLAVTACAEAPVSELYKPAVSETFRTLVGGKTFEVRINGINSVGQDEDAKFTISITVCEETCFEAEAVENLKEHDIVSFATGEGTMVMEVNRDEFGISIRDGNGDGYVFTRADDGRYTVRTETENIFYTDVFTVAVPLEKDIVFQDWSDPENLEAPVTKGFDELLELLLADTYFAPFNTRVTFDESGKLTEFLYLYSPWN